MTGSNVAREQLRHLGKLIHLIATLNFPDETASTRLRQIAFLMLIELEHQAGAKPTARSMSRLLNGPPSQMDFLAMSLERKGVLERVTTPAHTKGKPGKILYVRETAAEALMAHHKYILKCAGKELYENPEIGG